MVRTFEASGVDLLFFLLTIKVIENWIGSQFQQYISNSKTKCFSYIKQCSLFSLGGFV